MFIIHDAPSYHSQGGRVMCASLLNKANKAGLLVPLGTNVLTLAPGRYSVDGLTTEAEAMNLPVPAWHYEIDVLASENIAGLINNHKVIIAYPISTGDQYSNTMNYSGNWTGWMKTPTPADMADKVNLTGDEVISGLKTLDRGMLRIGSAEGMFTIYNFRGMIYRGSNSTVGEYPPESDFSAIVTATPPQEHDLPLEAGCTVFMRSKYFKSQENIVTFYAAVQRESGFSGALRIATLPAGFRPLERTDFPAAFSHFEDVNARIPGFVMLFPDGGLHVAANVAGHSIAYVFGSFVASA